MVLVLMQAKDSAALKAMLELAERYGFTVVVAFLLLLFILAMYRQLSNRNERFHNELASLLSKFNDLRDSATFHDQLRRDNDRLVAMLDEREKHSRDLVQRFAAVLAGDSRVERGRSRPSLVSTSSGYLSLIERDGALVVTVVREIMSLKSEIDSIVAAWDDFAGTQKDPKLIIDLSEATMIPSVVWGSFLILSKYAKECGGKMSLVGLRNDAKTQMRYMQLDRFWDVHETIADALK